MLLTAPEREGLDPEMLKVLADYLIGEVISIVCERRPDGRLAARVHFFDLEARELNEDPDETGVCEHQEYFTHYYYLSPAGDRVVEIQDADHNLIERDPLPWSAMPEVGTRSHRGAPGPRSRRSALSEGGEAVARALSVL